MTTRVRAALREAIASFGTVLANPALRRLQLANLGAVVGAWTYMVALAIYAYREDGAYAVGLLATVRWLCGGLAAPLAGMIGDRYPRLRVMAASDVARALLLGAMTVIALADGPSLAVYGLAVLATLAGTPFTPAEAALLPQLARSPAQLTAANAMANAADNVGSFFGPALGGAIVALASVEAAFVTAAVLHLWSAVLVTMIRHREEREAADDDEESGALRQALAGFRTIAGNPSVRLVVGLVAVQTVIDGALDVLIVLLALELLDVGAAGLGFLNSAAGVGGIAAAFAVGAVAGRGRLAGGLGVGIVLWGLPLVLIGVWPEQAVALVLFAVVGAGGTLVGVMGDTLLQRSAPPDVLARVFGAVNGVVLVSLAIGALGAPLLADAIGVRGALIVAGAVLPVVAALVWGRLTRIDAEALVAERPRELLTESPIFSPLPPPALEALAARLERRRARAGETVFAQGDPGDEYYVIEDGRVRVEVDGEPVAELGPGEGFGEIALLREVPRTATVVALTDLELYALEREHFLAAVTGHAESRAAAESLVVGRLSPAAL
jgi:MFS family permease